MRHPSVSLDTRHNYKTANGQRSLHKLRPDEALSFLHINVSHATSSLSSLSSSVPIESASSLPSESNITALVLPPLATSDPYYYYGGRELTIFVFGVFVAVCGCSGIFLSWLSVAISRGLIVAVSWGGADKQILIGGDKRTDDASVRPAVRPKSSLQRIAARVAAWQVARSDIEEACEKACSEYIVPTAAASTQKPKIGEDCVTLQQVRRLSDQCQLLSVEAVLQKAGLSAETQHPELRNLAGRVDRVKEVMEACATPDGNSWVQFSLDEGNCWRRWDLESQKLHLLMRFEAKGSLQQMVAALRDVDVAEPLWDGACWDMHTQHHGGASLVRWFQKDPISGRRNEVLLERVFCDCLDSDTPCWVLSERTPDVTGLDTFEGRYGEFDIPKPTYGFTRTVTTNSGRVIEPISANRCRISIKLCLELPAAVRWAVTDSVLSFAGRMAAKSTLQSWNKIIDRWDASGFEERIQRDSAFYRPINDRMVAMLFRNN